MTRSRPGGSPLYVVGIGASAGGLDAIERFFDHVPKEMAEETGMAFVLVQHLSPDFRSLMDELLARHTDLPIQLVEDAMLVEAGRVYLIPPKTEMIITGGRLLLSERSPQQELSLPIDVFFRSLAQDCGSCAVAVVLSGGGSDGSRGVRDVHEAGGLVLVQSAATAQFDGMPRTAIDAGVADHVLPPEDMPRVLADHAALREADASVSGAASEPKGIGAVHRMLEDEFGLDFTHYKPSTVTRRIERRLTLARSSDVAEYVARLRSERSELDTLYRDLLIGVTRFFRDPEAFAVLERHVLPGILQRMPRDATLRIWVAGCATGEEAYSIAIVLQELMAKHGERPVKIFASDVHRGSIERASQAIYDEEAVAGVSAERLERFFLRSGGAYQVVPELRRMIVFAAHNAIKDAPFTRVDLVSCRNLLIYLQPQAQQKVLSLFHFALNRGGVLFLGPSESIGTLTRDFANVDEHWRIYQKHTDSRVAVDPRIQPAPSSARGAAHLSVPPARYSVSQLLGTYDALLDEVMPPSLLVNDRGELVHAFAGASRFLRPRDGRLTNEVLDFVDSELRMVLAAGMRRALSEPGAIVFKGVRVSSDGGTSSHTVSLRRVQGKNGGAPHVLVSFEAMAGALREGAAATEIELDQVSREQVGTLEAELAHTKENLQSAIEELETSNEELQASNEELHASNEELQSTNEELYSVNAEYQRKIAELTELTNDMDNLLSSTQIGTIFLDRDLKVRKFTPQIAETFDLVLHDVGRSIETFAHKMDHPELLDDLKQVLSTGAPVERELRDARGRSFFLRLLPYRAKGAPAGVVLTSIDVSGLKAAEDALFHERYLLNSLLYGVPDAIYFKDVRGRFIRANQAMALRLGLADPKEAVGKTAFDLKDQGVALALHQQDQEVLRTGAAQHYRLEKRRAADGTDAWDLVTRLPLRDAGEEVVGVVVIFRDVTAQKHSEEKIQEAVRRRDQFLAMLSHELRNPLGAIVTATALLKGNGATPQDPARLLDIVDRQSRQMARLLDDLLEVSRVTQDKIELHGGTVSAHSDGEKTGSEFVVRLPLTDGPAIREHRGELAPRPPPPLPRASVVVVEDSADSREMLCELLVHVGFRCSTADSGPAALKLIDEVRPDIAILDVGLPGMDGFEVARRLRAAPAHAAMRLVALTGYGRVSDRLATRAAGFDEHLVKPVNVESLLRVLGDLRPRRAQEARATD